MAFEHKDGKFGPLVSVLIPSYNRPEYLHTAIESVLRQDYANIELLVIRDGGDPIGNVIRSFDDDRIVFIDRAENRGIAYTLNEALARARGKYISYLGNDDLYYRHHVARLVAALENETHCQVAYSDLYRTYCRIEQDGTREVLSKVVEVSRDFDRFVMLYFNHALHVSLMHRRDLVERIGPYNEDLNVLIDWDLTRRLCFFTDFYHVNDITGEYYSPVGESDRVSVRRRRDANEYLRNVLAIRTTRPAKPWPMLRDVSIILACEQLNRETADMLASIWRHTFYPYEVYLPVTRNESARLDIGMPNIVTVEVGNGASSVERVDAALARTEAEFAAVIPDGFPIREFWLEDSLYALTNSPKDREGFELEDSTENLWGVVLKTDDLREARRQSPGMSVRDCLAAGGVKIRRILADDIPFQFDQLLCQARSALDAGDCAQAGRMFENIGQRYGNEIWMNYLAADAYWKAEDFERAAELVRKVNETRPAVASLLLEARLKKCKKDFSPAITLLEQAERILEGKELVWT